MTEKVVLTKEQAKAIERWADKEQLIIAKVVGLLEHGLDEPLYALTTKELIQALFIGYEVEPEFKVGDWFVYIGKDGEVAEYIKKGFTGQVEAVHYGFITDGYHRFYNSEIRHATPSEIAEEKERRWWKELGREVGEFRKGDIGIHAGELLEVPEFAPDDDYILHYKRPDVKGYFTRKAYKTVRLVCP